MCKWSIVNAIKHCWEVNNHWKVFIGFKAAEAAADLEESNFNEAGRAENKLQCLVEEEWKGERIYSGSLPVKERRESVRGEGRVIKIGCNKKMRHNNNNEKASLRRPCKRTWTNVERTNNGGMGGIWVREPLLWARVSAKQVPACHGSQEHWVQIRALAVTKVFLSEKWG